jgi:hypothetical protein
MMRESTNKLTKEKLVIYEPKKIKNINVSTFRALDLENILYVVSQMILPRSHSEFKNVFKIFMEPFYPFKGNGLKMDLENLDEFKRRANLYLNK